jgi:SRSO17 transposase
MSEAREPIPTVQFVDRYCALYQDLFSDVRSREHFTLLHLGLISELARKSLPQLGRAVGLDQGQSLHHFVTDSPWSVQALRQRRLALLRRALHDRPFILCIDETGDRKKGKTTDYVARQYIGNLGKIENGLVSVNAYGVLEGITFPLLFTVFKPQTRLKAGDRYQTKPQLAIRLIRALKARGFAFRVVLADSLYGESDEFVSALEELGLKFVVAIRENHGVWLGPGARVRWTRWQTFDRLFSNGERETRSIRELIYGQRGKIRYYQITTDPQALPEDSTWLVMTNLAGEIQKEVGNVYGLRTWIEYGFKQIKNELGWADFRVTGYAEIERWWELVCSAYLLVSLQADVFHGTPEPAQEKRRRSVAAKAPSVPGHRWWDRGKGWKNVLNNLRLLLQPYISCCLISPWLEVFPIPWLREGFAQLITCLNHFPGHIPI